MPWPISRPLVAALAAAVVLTLLPGGGPAAAAPTSLADLRAEATRVRQTVDRMQTEIARLTEEYNAAAEAIDQAIAADLAGRRRLEEADAAVAAAQERMDQRARAAYQRGPVAGTAMKLQGFLHAGDWHEMLAVSAAVDAAAEADRDAVAALTKARAESAVAGGHLAGERAARQRHGDELTAKRAAIQQRVATLASYQARVDARVAELVEQERRRQEAARAAAVARLLAAGGGNVSTTGWQLGGSAAPVTLATEAQAQQAVSWAMGQVGKRYQWGASGPEAFDCSGLVLRAWEAARVRLPRTSREQFTVGAGVRRLADLRPGDLVFFGSSPATIHHVGMYVGDGAMVEAPYTGASVRVASIGRPDLVGAIRPGA